MLVSTTLFKWAEMQGLSGKSIRLNRIPKLTGAGLTVRQTLLPEWTPIPEQ